MDRCLGPAAHSNIRFAATDQSGRITDGLRPSRAGGHRRPERPFEAVLDGDMPGPPCWQETKAR